MLGNYTNALRWKIDTALTQLKESKCHGDFQRGIYNLSFICLCEADSYPLVEVGLDRQLQRWEYGGNVMRRIPAAPHNSSARILLTVPANAEDAALLITVMKFARQVIVFPAAYAHLQKTLMSSFEHVILEIIRGKLILPVELEGSDVDHTFDLQYEALLLGLGIFNQASVEYITAVVSKSDCIAILTNHLRRSSALDSQMTTLLLLSHFISIPGLAFVTQRESIVDLIGLLIYFITSHQRAHMYSTDYRASPYDGRGFYRSAVLCLRSICRTSLVDENDENSWIWGDYWTFNGSFEWLIVLLDDPEDFVQKLGMGILANLVLVDEATVEIKRLIPKFLEVAFENIANAQASAGVRKEAVLLVKNYAVGRYRKGRAQIGEETQMGERIREIFEAFEKHGFFSTLRESIECDPSMVSFRSSLSELLLCLSSMSPTYVRRVIYKSDAWIPLGVYLNDPPTSPSNEDEPEFFRHFRSRYCRRTNRRLIEMTKCNILEIIWLLGHEAPELKEYLVESTFIMDQLGALLRRIDANLSPDDKGTLLADNRLLELSVRVLNSLLCCAAALRPQELEILFKTPQTALAIFRLLMMMLNSSASTSQCRVGCQAAARILSLHCGLIVDMGLSEILATRIEADDAANTTVGTLLYDLLVKVLLKLYEADDAAYMESVRVSLQSLLGCYDFIKSHAIKGTDDF